MTKRSYELKSFNTSLRRGWALIAGHTAPEAPVAERQYVEGQLGEVARLRDGALSALNAQLRARGFSTFHPSESVFINDSQGWSYVAVYPQDIPKPTTTMSAQQRRQISDMYHGEYPLRLWGEAADNDVKMNWSVEVSTDEDLEKIAQGVWKYDEEPKTLLETVDKALERVATNHSKAEQAAKVAFELRELRMANVARIKVLREAAMANLNARLNAKRWSNLHQDEGYRGTDGIGGWSYAATYPKGAGANRMEKTELAIWGHAADDEAELRWSLEPWAGDKTKLAEGVWKYEDYPTEILEAVEAAATYTNKLHEKAAAVRKQVQTQRELRDAKVAQVKALRDSAIANLNARLNAKRWGSLHQDEGYRRNDGIDSWTYAASYPQKAGEGYTDRHELIIWGKTADDETELRWWLEPWSGDKTKLAEGVWKYEDYPFEILAAVESALERQAATKQNAAAVTATQTSLSKLSEVIQTKGFSALSLATSKKEEINYDSPGPFYVAAYDMSGQNSSEVLVRLRLAVEQLENSAALRWYLSQVDEQNFLVENFAAGQWKYDQAPKEIFKALADVLKDMNERLSVHSAAWAKKAELEAKAANNRKQSAELVHAAEEVLNRAGWRDVGSYKEAAHLNFVYQQEEVSVDTSQSFEWSFKNHTKGKGKFDWSNKNALRKFTEAVAEAAQIETAVAQGRAEAGATSSLGETKQPTAMVELNQQLQDKGFTNSHPRSETSEGPKEDVEHFAAGAALSEAAEKTVRTVNAVVAVDEQAWVEIDAVFTQNSWRFDCEYASKDLGDPNIVAYKEWRNGVWSSGVRCLKCNVAQYARLPGGSAPGWGWKFDDMQSPLDNATGHAETFVQACEAISVRLLELRAEPTLEELSERQPVKVAEPDSFWNVKTPVTWGSEALDFGDGHTQEMAATAIDCAQERRTLAQAKADGGGVLWAAPKDSSVSTGWKLHLNIPPNRRDPLTREVVAFLRARQLMYKIYGSNINTREVEPGRRLTVYVGDFDLATRLAQELWASFGGRLGPIDEATKLTNRQFVGDIWGRFSLTEAAYTSYGPSGVALRKETVSEDLQDMFSYALYEISPAVAPEVSAALQAAEADLAATFGAFYTGVEKAPKVVLDTPEPSNVQEATNQDVPVNTLALREVAAAEEGLKAAQAMRDQKAYTEVIDQLTDIKEARSGVDVEVLRTKLRQSEELAKLDEKDRKKIIEFLDGTDKWAIYALTGDLESGAIEQKVAVWAWRNQKEFFEWLAKSKAKVSEKQQQQERDSLKEAAFLNAALYLFKQNDAIEFTPEEDIDLPKLQARIKAIPGWENLRPETQALFLDPEFSPIEEDNLKPLERRMYLAALVPQEPGGSSAIGQALAHEASKPVSAFWNAPKEKFSYTEMYGSDKDGYWKMMEENILPAYRARERALRGKYINEGEYFVGDVDGMRGWKFHLNVPGSLDDATTTEVAAFLRARGVVYKVGHAGDQGGKGMTVYVGPRDVADTLAKELHERFKDRIAPPSELVAKDDVPFIGNIAGRFEVTGEDPYFRHYGAKGIPFLVSTSGTDPYAEEVETNASYRNFEVTDAAWEKADAKLRQQYGAYYTGEKLAHTLAEVRLAGAQESEAWKSVSEMVKKPGEFVVEVEGRQKLDPGKVLSKLESSPAWVGLTEEAQATLRARLRPGNFSAKDLYMLEKMAKAEGERTAAQNEAISQAVKRRLQKVAGND